MSYTSAEYADMIRCLGWAEGNASAAVERYKDLYPRRKRFPKCEVILGADRRVREYGYVMPNREMNAGRTLRVTPRREEAVIREFSRDSTASIRKVARRMNMCPASVHRIMKGSRDDADESDDESDADNPSTEDEKNEETEDENDADEKNTEENEETADENDADDKSTEVGENKNTKEENE